MLSIEDVEKIMEETEEGIEYQRVGNIYCEKLQQFLVVLWILSN